MDGEQYLRTYKNILGVCLYVVVDCEVHHKNICSSEMTILYHVKNLEPYSCSAGGFYGKPAAQQSDKIFKIVWQSHALLGI